MRAEGRKDLSKEMGRALSAAAVPVQASIKAEAAKVMPSEGGYRDLLTGSLRHRMSRRAGGQVAQVILTTYADGKKERRDVVALNKGILRHPLWGDRDVWRVTKIQAGFHDRGTEQAMDKAQAAMLGVIEDYAGRLAGS
jgi:hypothetical protein